MADVLMIGLIKSNSDKYIAHTWRIEPRRSRGFLVFTSPTCWSPALKWLDALLAGIWVAKTDGNCM